MCLGARGAPEPIDIQNQVIGVAPARRPSKPAGKTEARAAVELGGRYLVTLQDQLKVPCERIAYGQAHGILNAAKRAAARQEPLEIGKCERPQTDAEAVLALEAALAGDRGDPEPALDAEIEAGLLRQRQPAAGEAHDRDAHLEELLQHLLQPRGMPRLAGEVAGVEQLRVALPRVLGRDCRGPDAAEAADVAGKARVVRPIMVDRRLRIRPGAVEQQQQAMVEDVGKAGERRVALLLLATPGVVGQMDRQRSVRAEQPEKAHRKASGRGRFPGHERRQIGRRKGQVGLLTHPDRLLARPACPTQTRRLRMRPLQQTERLQELEPEGLGGERCLYSRCWLPSRVGHRMISPRSSVVTTVSVKLLRVTYLAKNCSSTAPSRNALGSRRLCSSSSSSISRPRPNVIGPGTGRRRTTGLLAIRTTHSTSLLPAGAG